MITVEEKFDGPVVVEGDNPSAELPYIILGTGDELAAKSALADESPQTYDNLPRRAVRIEKQLTNDIWEGVARYSLNEQSPPPQTGESSFAFDTAGGTQHITHSRGTVGIFPAPGLPGTPPDFQGAIGVTDNGVEGVDITVPVYQFSETHYLDNSVVTQAYKNTLFNLTGKVNNASFKGLAAGECLFLGASGSRRGTSGGDDWEITFRFAGSPNVTGLAIGPIPGIDKKGWEYLWVRYAETEDENASALVQRPIAAYVEQVYESGNFSALGIGT